MESGNISCGIALPQTFSDLSDATGFLRRFIPRAEALGYEGLWVQEQIVSDVPILEPVTLITYAAALTSKLHLGTSVLITVIRNPVHLAKSLASLDQLQDLTVAGSVDVTLHIQSNCPDTRICASRRYTSYLCRRQPRASRCDKQQFSPPHPQHE